MGKSLENKFIDYIDEVSNNLDYLKENLFEEIEQTINYIKNMFEEFMNFRQ